MTEFVVETASGGLEVLSNLRDDWRELLDHVGNDSIYWRPEWVLAALRAYAPAAKLFVIAVRQGAILCAIFPLLDERGKFAGLPGHKLRAPLTTAGVGIDIPCSVSGAARDEVFKAIWSVIRNKPHWDVLELPSVFEGASIERLASFAENECFAIGRWTLPLIASFSIPQGPAAVEELEKYPRHPKLRSKVRQREKKLAALGAVRLRRTERDPAASLQTFYDMEASGWKGRAKSAILSDSRSRQFFDEVVREAEKLGHLCLYTLELDGKAIAAHIGFTYRDRYWAAKSTYDENYRDYAPGHLIVKAILRDCHERGIKEYVMGIREDWKMEWTQNVSRRSYQCIFNHGLWPRLLYTVRFPLRRRLAALKARRRNV
jgi:CelD/BcsL family acetyltransferase involved in cellulose biosynthesis